MIFKARHEEWEGDGDGGSKHLLNFLLQVKNFMWIISFDFRTVLQSSSCYLLALQMSYRRLREKILNEIGM